MKKIVTFLLLIITYNGYAQVKLGIKFAPFVSLNRVTDDLRSIENDGGRVKYAIGLIMDKPFSDIYYLSSGLIYVPKRVAFRRKSNRLREEYKLQYLQIPASLKFFTNEVAPDFKVYFQIGGGIEIKIFSESENVSPAITRFNPVDLFVLIGSGLEYNAGVNTTIFGGISYQRGLSNVIHESSLADSPRIRNTIVSLDLGIKF